jgi:hypothetical protein
MAVQLSRVGCVAIWHASKIYALIMYKSSDDDVESLFGATPQHPKWVVYGLTNEHGRVLLDLFNTLNYAQKFLAEKADELRLVKVTESVAVRHGITILVHPVASGHKHVKIRLTVIPAMRQSTITIPQPLEFEEAATMIGQITEKLNRPEGSLFTRSGAARDMSASETPQDAAEPVEMTS